MSQWVKMKQTQQLLITSTYIVIIEQAFVWKISILYPFVKFIFCPKNCTCTCRFDLHAKSIFGPLGQQYHQFIFRALQMIYKIEILTLEHVVRLNFGFHELNNCRCVIRLKYLARLLFVLADLSSH